MRAADGHGRRRRARTSTSSACRHRPPAPAARVLRRRRATPSVLDAARRRADPGPPEPRATWSAAALARRARPTTACSRPRSCGATPTTCWPSSRLAGRLGACRRALGGLPALRYVHVTRARQGRPGGVAVARDPDAGLARRRRRPSAARRSTRRGAIDHLVAPARRAATRAWRRWFAAQGIEPLTSSSTRTSPPTRAALADVALDAPRRRPADVPAPPRSARATTARRAGSSATARAAVARERLGAVSQLRRSRPRPSTSCARSPPSSSGRCCCSAAARTRSCCCGWPRRRSGPAPFPFPILHVDTGHNFPEVLEFRDRRVDGARRAADRRLGAGLDRRRPRAGRGRAPSRNRLQTVTLLDAIEEHGFDAAFGGARRDEERARAKERVLSFRDEFGQWEPRNQRPEVWDLYNGRVRRGEHVRVFPLSQLDRARRLALHRGRGARAAVDLLRPRARVFERDGMLLAESEYSQPADGEEVVERGALPHRRRPDRHRRGALGGRRLRGR